MVVPLKDSLLDVWQLSPSDSYMAYIDSSGVLHYRGHNITMGGISDNNKVIEFTIKSSTRLYVRNSDGFAREVFLFGSRIEYGGIINGVIRLAGGKMLAGSNSFALTDDGSTRWYTPIGNKGEIDMIPVIGSSGEVVYNDTTDATKKRAIKYNGNTYILRKDGKIYKNDVEIMSGVVDMTLAYQDGTNGYQSGNLPNPDVPQNWNNVVVSRTKNFLASSGADAGWVSAYENFMNTEAQHPSCQWSGVGEVNNSVRVIAPCIVDEPAINDGKIARGVFVLKTDGKIYDINGVEQISADTGANGFNAFYRADRNGKLITIRPFNQKSKFCDIEMGGYDNYMATMLTS